MSLSHFLIILNFLPLNKASAAYLVNSIPVQIHYEVYFTVFPCKKDRYTILYLIEKIVLICNFLLTCANSIPRDNRKEFYEKNKTDSCHHWHCFIGMSLFNYFALSSFRKRFFSNVYGGYDKHHYDSGSHLDLYFCLQAD